MNLVVIGILLAFIAVTASEPTMYKKNDNNMYEPDLVAVSSTVIPEVEMPDKEKTTAEMDEEFKKAYYRLFNKKFSKKFAKPDTLLTDKKAFAKVSKEKVSEKPEKEV